MSEIRIGGIAARRWQIVVLAIFAVRPLAMFLTPEVRPTDPSTFVSVPAALFAVALSAIVSPALRAIRVDPITALHND